MTTNGDESSREFEVALSRRWMLWLLIPAILGAVIGGVLAARGTPIYKSEILLAVVPPRIPESLVPSTNSTTIGDRLQMISQQVLSRTKLERIIQEFDLYREERRNRILEEVIEHMRENVEVNLEAIDRGDTQTFRLGFTGTDAQTVMKVTERLGALFIQENRADKVVLANVAVQFLETQLDDIRPRIVAHGKQLRAARERRQPDAETLAIEQEVLHATFKDLSAKIEESRIAADLERAHIGEQWKVLASARLPERPIAPDWRTHVGAGAAGGAAVGVVVLLLLPTRRREAPHAEAPASSS